MPRNAILGQILGLDLLLADDLPSYCEAEHLLRNPESNADWPQVFS
jgi:hypothetical protein